MDTYKVIALINVLFIILMCLILAFCLPYFYLKDVFAIIFSMFFTGFAVVMGFLAVDILGD